MGELPPSVFEVINEGAEEYDEEEFAELLMTVRKRGKKNERTEAVEDRLD